MNWTHYFKDVWLVGSRYMVIASLAFLIAYVLLRKTIAGKKIQQKFPRIMDYGREIGFSVLTIFVMAFIPAMVLGTPSIAKYTKFYYDINQHSRLWFFLAFPIMAFMHDTYFYWTHRIMHLKLFFPTFHKIHHLSTNPTPWAAFSFHPLEAIVEAGILPVIVFLIPVHPAAIFIFLFFMTLMNVLGHLGYEKKKNKNCSRMNRNEKDNHR